MGGFKQLIPRHGKVDQFAFTFTHCGLVGMAVFQLLLVLPKYHPPLSTMYNIHLFFGLFFAYQVFSNMYSMILAHNNVKTPGLHLPCVLQPGWKYCAVCRMNAPPRSHHCPKCEVCVLKRDHHCVFTGNCVSFHNHRYFMCFVLYLWVGCLYSFLFAYEYYLEVLGEVGFGLLFKLLFPTLVWTTGHVDSFELFILLVMAVNLFAMILFSTLIGFQVLFISRGQTQFELKKKIRDYDLGMAENWKLVLGGRWYLVWLSCYVTSQLPGDGLEFKTVSGGVVIHEDPKEV